MSELRKVFDHPIKGGETGDRLLMLKQEGRSVVDYVVELRVLAAESGWDSIALRRVFVRGLSEVLKDELASRDEHSNLDDPISLVVRLDNRLRESLRERATLPASCTNVLPEQFKAPLAEVFNAPMVSSPPRDQEEPMQLGGTRLSASERQTRLRSGRRLYCGKPGHRISAYPCLLKALAHQ